ncbi:MAG TPA: lasso peptide biosynthesis B2 protein [Chloroflexia bacterium]|nr:lasso peptide biosynthesis B2 protein [Chloroflexia bacterium]
MACLKWLRIRLSYLADLGGQERRILALAFIVFPLVVTSLKLAGFKRTQYWLSRLLESEKEILQEEMAGQAKNTARLVKIAARYQPYRASCLAKSIVLWWLLGLQEIKSEVCIGVSRDKGKFEAHAWVECQGLVLNDSKDVRQRFPALERRMAGERV